MWDSVNWRFRWNEFAVRIPSEEVAEPDSAGEGEETSSDSAGTAPPIEQAIRHTEVPLYIGSDARGYVWNGTIDELVLYRRALSANEVLRLHEATSHQR